ncbi:MAG: UDP-N-acetylglucosamine 2-epimerase [Lactobacillus rogosae]
MKKVAFATGSRADYGIMREYLRLLNNDENIDLSILVTGALLDDKYGNQVSLIEDDGFYIESKVKVDLNSTSNKNILLSIGEIIKSFAEVFDKNKYDLLIILGDRYEMLSVAISAAINRIPILHIHGGEATYGNYDEFIRHSITKMSMYHFTATEIYRKRVIQLGESPDRVYYLGALGAENCLKINEKNVPEYVKNMDKKSYFVILFHPETLTNINVLDQVNELLNAIKRYSQYKYVFLGTNADTYSDIIRKRIKDYVDENSNTVYIENLHTDAYHYMLKNSICLIGNSSSGIIEAPSLGIYTINIGDRQKGRVRGNSVIDVKCDRKQIDEAISRVINMKDNIEINNPYYKENSIKEYYKYTKMILEHIIDDIKEPKIFYDIKMQEDI